MAESNPTASSSKGTNVQVAVRCRPLNAEERRAGQPSVITCESENKSIKVSYGPAGKKTLKAFNFDRVFGAYSTQEEVFEQVVRPIVDEALAGFNCTIFAYGQTGTGKTHTMEGDIHSEENAGIVPRSVKAILEQLEASGSEFTIRVSFLELYNEELQDLLSVSSDKKLKLCEDIKKGVVCQNLEEITVLNVSDIFEILQRGIQQRQTAATLCNKNSSRSHSIFTMKIMIKECNVDGEEVVRHGQLNLVDLAGSECVGRSGAKNDRAREAGSINQSLLTLGRVITALVDHHGHIPYRDSKLTRLLQESLGGKAKTCIIATLSPSQLAVEESMSTLDYAYRAKNIKNQPTLNQRMTKKVVLKEYCAEIELLKASLQMTREKNGVYVDPAEFYSMEARLAAQENQIVECESALRQKFEEVKSLRSDRDSIAMELDDLRARYEQAQSDLIVVTESNERNKAALQKTTIELKATEAVVGEQVRTESTLHNQGSVLQEEVRARRTDVDGLFGKISRCASAESSQQKCVVDMIAALKRSKEEMDRETSVFGVEAEKHSALLRAGVTTMLEKSRQTCDSLRQSIDGALNTLIVDASDARDSMTKSCDVLDTHLRTTNQHIADTLLDVQQKLSAWLGEVSVSMTEAQVLLAAQQTQLDQVSRDLVSRAEEYTSKSNELLAMQEKHASELLIQSNELKKDFSLQLAQFKENQLVEAAAAENALKSQAQLMEQSMKSMLAELVSRGIETYSSHSSRTETFCKAADASSNAGFEKISSTIFANQGRTRRDLQDLEASVLTAQRAHSAILSEASESRTQTVLHLDSVSGSVGAKRSLLDSTVTILVERVDGAMKEGCEAVSATSTTANTVLSAVTTATSRMNESAGLAMSSFTSFLDGEGQQIESTVSTHFNTLSEHSSKRQKQLDSAMEGVDNFGETMVELRLQPSNSTPKKLAAYAALESLASTRSHEVIKAKAREAASITVLDGEADSTDNGEASSTGMELVGGSFEVVSSSDDVDEMEIARPDDAFPVKEASSTGSEDGSIEGNENGNPNNKPGKRGGKLTKAQSMAQLDEPSGHLTTRRRGASAKTVI